MDIREYKKRKIVDFTRILAVTTRPLKNGVTSVPSGTRCRATKTHGALITIETDPCPTCGTKVYMTHVAPGDIELVEVPA